MYPDNFGSKEGGNIAGILIAISCYFTIASPLVGLIYDKIGVRGLFGIIGQLVINISFFIMILIPSSAKIAIVGYAVFL